MSASQLFPTTRSLVDLPAPEPPTRKIRNSERGGEKLIRAAHLLRFSPHAPGWRRSDARAIISQHALTHACGRQFGHKNGQSRVVDAMMTGQPLEDILRDATSQELRRAGMSQATDLLVLEDDEEVKQQFGDTLWEQRPKRMRVAWGRCFISGKDGDGSIVHLHHEHVYRQDILVAPVTRAGNHLLTGLCASGGDFDLFPLHQRINLTGDLCAAMDSIKENYLTTTYPWIEAGRTEGHIALREALSPGGDLAHLLTSRVPDDLRAKAGLQPGDRALMFTSSALRTMPFVSRQTVFHHTVKNNGDGNNSYLKVVYGRCPITGVGGRKTDKSHWPVVLHHITWRGRHYLVGFILDQMP